MGKRSRIEKAEKKARAGEKVMKVFFMDHNDDNLYHQDSGRKDENPLTRAEAEGQAEELEKQHGDVMVLWVDYTRAWRGDDPETLQA